MKIISAEQTRKLDQYTIENEPIASIDLMERASMAFVNWFTQEFDNQNSTVHIFCGPGNNGGDGLAIARLLHHSYFNVHIYRCKISDQVSEDYAKNLERLPRHGAIKNTIIEKGTPFPALSTESIIIDALFGSGLNRPVEGYWAELIQHLNNEDAIRVAIDIPSGIFADRHSEGTAFQAHRTFSFQLPKLAFFFAENFPCTGNWEVGDIGLSAAFLNQLESAYYYLDLSLAQPMYIPRKKYDHKGSFGHALIVAGSYGMIGAAILATKAAMRSGAGLVTVHSPEVAYSILQTTVPEAMVSIDTNTNHISGFPDLSKYSAIGVGPGIGTKKLTISALDNLIKSYTLPLVLDADALNSIAKNKELLPHVPKNSILTPHPKEFERLFGKTTNDFERNALQRKKAQELQLYILLKGAHSCIACPDGSCYFNSTGNPGMASGGSGDVLTGIITGLLAQNYSPKAAVLLGVYLHGLAGDLALEHIGSEEAMVASDLIDHLGKAFRKIKLN